MRDEFDGRFWVDNHEQFSAGIGEALAGLRSTLFRLPTWDGTAAQLLALIAAFVITALTFNTTTA